MNRNGLRSAHSGPIRDLLGAFTIVFWSAIAFPPPAAATVTNVIVAPADPTICNAVTLTATGSISSPCYEIVGAKITGPDPIPCMRPGPCPSLFRIEITVRASNLEVYGGCPLATYRQPFDVGKLAAGEYGVTAVERVIPFAPESVGTTLDSSFVSTRFAVRSDSTCQPGAGCYILDFVSDVTPPDSTIIPLLPCTATTAPGGMACLDLGLLNSVPIGGLQTTVAVSSRYDSIPPPVAFFHATSVEPTGRARGFQVGWSADGARTKLILYSPSGALIEPGHGPVARICYSVSPETVPGIYPIHSIDEIVADSTGAEVMQCPTFARLQGGRICVTSPACDLNGDGVSDILDVIKLVRCALGAGRDPAACPDSVAARADCNGDGSLDVRDVICCVRKILHFPRGPEPLGTGTPDGAPAGEIGFAGPVRWINEVEGFVTLEIKPRDDWGGAQFSLDPVGSPVRIRDVKLLEDPNPDRLEWADDGTGVAHAILYAVTSGPRSVGLVRVQVALERIPGSGGGTLRLVGVRSGTLSGSPAPIATVNAAVELSKSVADAPALLTARPNPFFGRTEAGFALPSEMRVTLRLYDVAGRLVRTLVDEMMPAGIHRVTWDGTDSRGRQAPAAIYFARFTAGLVHRSERLLLLR